MASMRTSSVFIVALCLSAQFLSSVNAASVSQNNGDVKPCGRNPQASSTPMPAPPAVPSSAAPSAASSSAAPPAVSSSAAPPAVSSSAAPPTTTAAPPT